MLFLIAVAACPAGAASQPDAGADELPPGFRGEITYSGTYSGELTTKAERIRSPGIGEVVRSLASSRTLALEGEYALTIRFEGNIVQGSARFLGAPESGGVPLELGSFTGLRTGGDCTIQWGEGPRAEARCGRGAFAYSFAEFEDQSGDEITLSVTASPIRIVDFRQREYERIAQRVLQIESFAGRVAELRASYGDEGVMPAFKCYRMRQEVGLYDGQLADLAWLAAGFEEIGADVASSGDAAARAVWQSLPLPEIDKRLAATRDGRSAAEANYDTACPKA